MRGIGESFFTVRSTIVTEIKRRNHKYRFLELRECTQFGPRPGYL
jgi:hypothetical protein